MAKKCACCGKLHVMPPVNARLLSEGDALDGRYWECACGSTLYQPDFTARRHHALALLTKHAWYGRIILKLSEAEFDEVVGLIDDHGELNRDEWTMQIQRLFLDQPEKPKKLRIYQDILMAAREPQ